MSKKIIMSFTLLISLFLFGSCALNFKRHRFDYEELKEQVVSIELINYDNNEARRVKDIDSILPFDFDKMEVVETLDESRFEDFIDDFDHVTLRDFERRSRPKYDDAPAGIGLKLTYECGDFIIMTSFISDREQGEYSDFIVRFDKEGQAKDAASFFDNRDDYVELVNKYFETQIEYRLYWQHEIS